MDLSQRLAGRVAVITGGGSSMSSMSIVVRRDMEQTYRYSILRYMHWSVCARNNAVVCPRSRARLRVGRITGR